MKNLLFILLSLSIINISGAPKKNNKQKPNIILILVDDLGKEWSSSYGAKDITTPNIDALANNGILFNNVYSMPQCTPTRLTLMTGQYPFRNG
jgi:arylsulfatase A-like enzyme